MTDTGFYKNAALKPSHSCAETESRGSSYASWWFMLQRGEQLHFAKIELTEFQTSYRMIDFCIDFWWYPHPAQRPWSPQSQTQIHKDAFDHKIKFRTSAWCECGPCGLQSHVCVSVDHLDIKYTSVLDPWLLHRNQTVEFTTSRALAAQQRAFQQNEGTVECKSIIYLWSQFRRLYSFGFSLTLVDWIYNEIIVD